MRTLISIVFGAALGVVGVAIANRTAVGKQFMGFA
jgi:hypothetical protein